MKKKVKETGHLCQAKKWVEGPLHQVNTDQFGKKMGALFLDKRLKAIIVILYLENICSNYFVTIVRLRECCLIDAGCLILDAGQRTRL